MASSSSKGGSKGKPQSATVQSEAVAPAGGNKKKKTVRMTQEQIDRYLAFKKTEPLVPLDGARRLIDRFSQEMLSRMPKDLVERLADFDLDKVNQGLDFINKAEEDLAMEAENVRRQYEEKGYVEYEVTDDGEEESNPPAPAPVYPAPGRRRHRPGVARKSGATKRLN